MMRGTVCGMWALWQYRWRQDLKKPWVVAIWAGMLVLLLWSTYQETQSYRHYQRSQAEMIAQQRHLWEHQGALNPHTAVHHGLYAFKPWLPLSVLEPGLQAYLGSTVFLEGHRQNIGTFVPAADQLRLSALAVLTPAALFQQGIPLVIILLGYGCISQLRSQGTLAFLVAYGLSRRAVLMAEGLYLSTLVLLMVLPTFVLSSWWLFQQASWQNTAWQWLGFWMAFGLYWAIFIQVTLLVSGVSSKSRQALFVLFMLWLCNGLVLPRSMMARTADLPAYSVLQAHIQKDVDALPDWQTRLSQLDLPPEVNAEAEVLKASEADETAVFDKHMQALYDRYTQGVTGYYRWRMFVPALALQQLSQGLAQSDLAAHQNFLQAAEAYRQRYILQLNEVLSERSAEETFSYVAGNELWQQVPEFEAPHTLTGTQWQKALESLGFLGLWWLVSLAALGFYQRRYEVLP